MARLLVCASILSLIMTCQAFPQGQGKEKTCVYDGDCNQNEYCFIPDPLPQSGKFHCIPKGKLCSDDEDCKDEPGPLQSHCHGWKEPKNRYCRYNQQVYYCRNEEECPNKDNECSFWRNTCVSKPTDKEKTKRSSEDDMKSMDNDKMEAPTPEPTPRTEIGGQPEPTVGSTNLTPAPTPEESKGKDDKEKRSDDGKSDKDDQGDGSGADEGEAVKEKRSADGESEKDGDQGDGSGEDEREAEKQKRSDDGKSDKDGDQEDSSEEDEGEAVKEKRSADGESEKDGDQGDGSGEDEREAEKQKRSDDGKSDKDGDQEDSSEEDEGEAVKEKRSADGESEKDGDQGDGSGEDEGEAEKQKRSDDGKSDKDSDEKDVREEDEGEAVKEKRSADGESEKDDDQGDGSGEDEGEAEKQKRSDDGNSDKDGDQEDSSEEDEGEAEKQKRSDDGKSDKDGDQEDGSEEDEGEAAKDKRSVDGESDKDGDQEDEGEAVKKTRSDDGESVKDGDQGDNSGEDKEETEAVKEKRSADAESDEDIDQGDDEVLESDEEDSSSEESDEGYSEEDEETGEEGTEDEENSKSRRSTKATELEKKIGETSAENPEESYPGHDEEKTGETSAEDPEESYSGHDEEKTVRSKRHECKNQGLAPHECKDTLYSKQKRSADDMAGDHDRKDKMKSAPSDEKPEKSEQKSRSEDSTKPDQDQALPKPCVYDSDCLPTEYCLDFTPLGFPSQCLARGIHCTSDTDCALFFSQPGSSFRCFRPFDWERSFCRIHQHGKRPPLMDIRRVPHPKASEATPVSFLSAAATEYRCKEVKECPTDLHSCVLGTCVAPPQISADGNGMTKVVPFATQVVAHASEISKSDKARKKRAAQLFPSSSSSSGAGLIPPPALFDPVLNSLPLGPSSSGGFGAPPFPGPLGGLWRRRRQADDPPQADDGAGGLLGLRVAVANETGEETAEGKGPVEKRQSQDAGDNGPTTESPPTTVESDDILRAPHPLQAPLRKARTARAAVELGRPLSPANVPVTPLVVLKQPTVISGHGQVRDNQTATKEKRETENQQAKESARRTGDCVFDTDCKEDEYCWDFRPLEEYSVCTIRGKACTLDLDCISAGVSHSTPQICHLETGAAKGSKPSGFCRSRQQIFRCNTPEDCPGLTDICSLDKVCFKGPPKEDIKEDVKSNRTETSVEATITHHLSKRQTYDQPPSEHACTFDEDCSSDEYCWDPPHLVAGDPVALVTVGAPSPTEGLDGVRKCHRRIHGCNADVDCLTLTLLRPGFVACHKTGLEGEAPYCRKAQDGEPTTSSFD
ncbi:unnamed protein product [Cyprideis torosa]|uniref:Uncharacterized protein n=1 Tax=Cyprideis torosa TaxID=163714 RepID=A0A7R8W5Q9_9CRUS|nr:unnamed protein product [Cyprideis torosa]CAG0885578.1 unnamed protein product [Cyprideis torosa]